MKPVSTRDAILAQALALDPADRAFVADELERSLPQTAFESSEIADAWSQEIDRRLDAYDRGETRSIRFEIAVDEIKGALDDYRSRRPQS